MKARIFDSSSRFKARMAGALYWFSLVTAALGELVFHARLSYAAGLIAVAGMIAMTLLLHDVFQAVNRGVSLLAASFGLVGLAFEALRLNPGGVDIALVFHGLYCILIGYLIFRSNFLPSGLGVLLAFAGVAWLTFLSPSVASYLSPYNQAAGILGDGSVFVWLLVAGVRVQRWQGQTPASGVRA